MMSAEWLQDMRKVPNEVMNYIRRLAVRAVEEQHQSPELVAKVFGISRSSLYEWLRRYRLEGEEALDSGSAPGAKRVITPEMDQWLRDTILSSTPQTHGYDTVLWSCPIVVALLKQRYGIEVSVATVRIHLHDLNLSPQEPSYRSRQQDEAKVAHFINDTFPRIQKLAEKMGADIGFEDEAGVGVRTRAGHSWGEVGHPPEIAVSEQRGGYNVLSIINAEGEFQAAERLVDAGRVLNVVPEAMQLRYLSALADIANDRSNTIVFPFPTDLADLFGKRKNDRPT